MTMRNPVAAVAIAVVMAGLALPAWAADTPKRGGTLTYLIPADAPPSFDGHKEQTFATVHATAPFYSVLIRVNPDNPASTTDFVCDLCTEMPKPADDGKTYTFKIRDGVKFHDGSPLTAEDVAASWNEIVFPGEGVFSARKSFYEMVDKIEAPDPHTVVFHLKFATGAFVPALADPFAYIYEKKILDDPSKGPQWYEKNIMGSGPFKFAGYEAGQSIKGERNPDYYQQGKPYLDAIVGLFAPKQATRVDAIRADRAQIEFRGLPPSSRDELKKELGDQIAVQESVWNCGSDLFFNHKQKPFDDVRVRRALSLAIDRWGGAEALSKIAIVKAVGGIVFPESPLAMDKNQLHEVAGFWPDIDKARTEAKRLLQEAGVQNLSFELLNRDVDQPYKYIGIWLVDQWSKIGVHVTQKVVPTGPWFEAMRTGNFSVVHYPICHSTVNPLLDVQPYLPTSISSENYGYYEDPKEVDLYNRMLHEPDPQKQRAYMNAFEKLVMDGEAHATKVIWWNRIIPYRSYVKGFKISPSHYINQDLATIWLDK
ncbi:MAG: ABC transporter substrate-binding protein [Alphaproteobacteria bacterium]|nr:ABC transporter substrate-binding protein [Alphaproteobacteria bacterium]